MWFASVIVTHSRTGRAVFASHSHHHAKFHGTLTETSVERDIHGVVLFLSVRYSDCATFASPSHHHAKFHVVHSRW